MPAHDPGCVKTRKSRTRRGIIFPGSERICNSQERSPCPSCPLERSFYKPCALQRFHTAKTPSRHWPDRNLAMQQRFFVCWMDSRIQPEPTSGLTPAMAIDPARRGAADQRHRRQARPAPGACREGAGGHTPIATDWRQDASEHPLRPGPMDRLPSIRGSPRPLVACRPSSPRRGLGCSRRWRISDGSRWPYCNR